MKKNFLLKYIPAQVRERKTWRITFSQVDPVTGKIQSFRKTFNLNRIKNIPLRRRRAKEICDELNSLLPFGYPFVDVNTKALMNDEENELFHTPIIDALKFIFELKIKSDRESTPKTYRTTYTFFNTFLENEGLEKLTISQFKLRHARSFMDAVWMRPTVNSNNTYNNYLTIISLFFSELKNREYIKDNPFQQIKKKRKTKANRRRFTEKERVVVANYFHENDIWMFYGILLQYYCYIRPIELIRLKKSNFLIHEQKIFIPADIIKTKITRYATIPDSIMHFFKHPRFASIPRHHYIFAPGICPGKTPYKKKDKMYKKHRKVLLHLLKVGKLEDITNLVWYSWKYSGNKDAKNEMSPHDIQKQNGHQSIKQTEEYMLDDVDEINIPVKNRSFNLLG